MHTEAEAREKWCPQMSHVRLGVERVEEVCCVASLCMAWRWGVQEGDPRKVGYCGLAGKP